MRRIWLRWVLVLGVLVFVGAVGGSVALALVEDYDAATTLTIVVGVIAALSGLVAAVGACVAAWLTWAGNRSNTERTAQMAEDMRRLADLQETSLEELRARRPEPAVGFSIDGTAKAVTAMRMTRRSPEVEIDVETIVMHEREQALATMPRPRPPRPETAPNPSVTALSPALAEVVAGLERQRFGNLLGRGHVTEDERKSFEDEVENYDSLLRQWLEDYRDFLQVRWAFVSLSLCFENLGRVPTHDARVHLRFPDPFGAPGDGGIPSVRRPPRRPRFVRSGPFGGLGSRSVLDRIPTLTQDIPFPRINANVSGPRYTSGGSVGVDITVTKLLHGVPATTYEDDPIVLRAPEDGKWKIPWTIRAENLPEATEGTLTLAIETAEPLEGRVTRLDALLPKDAEGDRLGS